MFTQREDGLKRRLLMIGPEEPVQDAADAKTKRLEVVALRGRDEAGDEVNPDRLDGFGLRVDGNLVVGGGGAKRGKRGVAPLGGLSTEGLKEFDVPTFSGYSTGECGQPLLSLLANAPLIDGV